MAGVYRPRHPERTVFYRVLFHYFDRFLAEYEGRFEKEYGFLRPIIKEVVERYLDCGSPRCGFARICCPDCQAERLLSWRHTGFNVHSRVRADFDLRCFFERLACNKGANKAKVATARRLLTIIYKVLGEGSNYVAYQR